MSGEDNLAGDLPFTLYRLQVALAMPVSPYREALLRALEKRLQAERALRQADTGFDSYHFDSNHCDSRHFDSKHKAAA